MKNVRTRINVKIVGLCDREYKVESDMKSELSGHQLMFFQTTYRQRLLTDDVWAFKS